ncbi:acetyl-CoA synthetase [Candidatus Geothermarchaeota archaeon ex4572_27]|nr:MAG: acetyl-CoA synthetase [Candidatus Geothermarchaeota archaeon ex4572_27]
MAGGRALMDVDEAFRLLERYGIPYPRYAIASADEVERAAEDVGYPLVLKLVSREVVHKSDVGGVVTGIRGPEELRAALAEMERRLGHVRDRRYMVQRMVRGVELAAGGLRDRVFGPVVMFGLGGILIELYRDVSFRLAPIDRREALEMIGEIRASRILDGYRGLPPVDRERLADVLVSLSRLIAENEEIAEIDINPLICSGDEVYAVDR